MEESGSRGIGRPTRWQDLSWTDVPHVVDTQPIAILPLGAIEQHGPHLPLNTDVLAAQSLAERVAREAKLVLLPALTYGPVWSLSRFPGSLSIRETTFVQLVCEIAQSLSQSKVRGLVLLSGHLGNANAARQAARQLEEERVLPCLYLTYPGLSQVSEQVRTSPQSHPHIVHADEIETSILLSLAPEAVRMERAVDEYPTYPPHFDYAPLKWDEVSKTGVFGGATSATREKGDEIVNAVVSSALSAIRSWRDCQSL